MSDLKRTPLYESHLACGGKIVPFAGWEMPVQYPAGLVQEHECVRENVGLFDVSHMGEIEVQGSGAISYLDYVTCNAVKNIKDGQAQYSALTNPEGGVIDDIIIYRFSAEHFLLCVNAANADIDFAWLKEHEREDATVTNVSDQYAQIAVQGPKSFTLLERVFQKNFGSELKPFWFMKDMWQESPVIIARTGYTGEDGVEVFVAPEMAAELWDTLLAEGEDLGVLPCGLGARDSLRLEVCYPLHGHELSPQVSAIESGLGWIVKPEKKGDFIGRAVLEREKSEGAKRTLAGFFVEEKGIVREGTEILTASGESAGVVTSGTRTPTVGKREGKALGLMLIAGGNADVGSELRAVVRGKELPIRVAQTPFYRKSS